MKKNKQTNEKTPKKPKNKTQRKLLRSQRVLLAAVFDYVSDKYIIQDSLCMPGANHSSSTPSRIKEIRKKNLGGR